MTSAYRIDTVLGMCIIEFFDGAALIASYTYLHGSNEVQLTALLADVVLSKADFEANLVNIGKWMVIVSSLYQTSLGGPEPDYVQRYERTPTRYNADFSTGGVKYVDAFYKLTDGMVTLKPRPAGIISYSRFVRFVETYSRLLIESHA